MATVKYSRAYKKGIRRRLGKLVKFDKRTGFRLDKKERDRLHRAWKRQRLLKKRELWQTFIMCESCSEILPVGTFPHTLVTHKKSHYFKVLGRVTSRKCVYCHSVRAGSQLRVTIGSLWKIIKEISPGDGANTLPVGTTILIIEPVRGSSFYDKETLKSDGHFLAKAKNHVGCAVCLIAGETIFLTTKELKKHAKRLSD